MGSKISSKGQITVPKEVRDALGLATGDSVSFMVMEGQAVLKREKKWTVDDMAGFLKDYNDPPLPPKEVYRAQVKKMLAERDRRTRSKGR